MISVMNSLLFIKVNFYVYFYFKEKMKTLKDKWQNGDDTDIPDEMDVIMSCNTSLVRGDNKISMILCIGDACI